MARYKVLAGRHHDEATGKTYTRGQVVEDDRDLCEMFANKFERVDYRGTPDDAAAVPEEPSKLGGKEKSPRDGPRNTGRRGSLQFPAVVTSGGTMPKDSKAEKDAGTGSDDGADEFPEGEEPAEEPEAGDAGGEGGEDAAAEGVDNEVTGDKAAGTDEAAAKKTGGKKPTTGSKSPKGKKGW